MHGTAGLAVQSIIAHVAFRPRLLTAATPPRLPCQQCLPLGPLAQNADPVSQPQQGWSKHTNQ